MVKPVSVISSSGDYEEAIERYAKHLGKEKIRRRVFNEIYGRARKPRSKKEIMIATGIENDKSQQVQNALEYLQKHELIIRHENEGRTSDGSRYVYGKADFIRANKAKIVQYAENPKAAAAMPTKRRPAMRGVTSLRRIPKSELRKREHLNVLYLVANPEATSQLQVDREVRRVQQEIRGSKFRDNITVEYRPAADLNTLLNGLNDLRPQIVHFSGHGSEVGIATDTGELNQITGKLLSFDLLAKALAATDNPPDIVVLNSCKSSAAKKALLPYAKMIITMKISISDTAATVFATRFYAAIASGQSVKSAFEQGRVAVEEASIGEYDTPELLHTPGTKPDSITLT